MPWFQLNHLPSCVVIAHEVGHAIERDFQLSEPLKLLFTNLDIEIGRRPAWLSWRHEIFADFFGILCCGPAYVIALISFLLDSKDEIQKEKLNPTNWGDYPSRFLRVQLNLEILSQLNFFSPTDENIKDDKLLALLSRLKTEWQKIYHFHLNRAYEEDIPHITLALLNQKFVSLGNKTIREIINYSFEDLAISWKIAKRINRGFGLDKDLQFLNYFSGMALAFYDDSKQYSQKVKQDKLLEFLLKNIPLGVRSTRLIVEKSTRQDETDRNVGQQLTKLFSP